MVENTIKNTHFKLYLWSQSKCLLSCDRNTISKNIQKQRKFEHKMAPREKLQT